MSKAKVLGLPILATLVALLGASPASAADFAASQYPATLSAEGIGDQHLQTKKLPNGTICDGSDFTAAVSGPQGTLAPAIPDSTCYTLWGTAKLEMNGCTFEYNAGSDVPPYGNEVFEGSFDIGPAECGPITLKAGGCTTEIGPQTGLPASFTNEGEGEAVDLDVSVVSLEYKQLAGGNCTAGTYTNGKYEAEWEMTAKDSKGNPIDAFVDPESYFPQFEATSYPTAIGGEQDPEQKLVLTVEKGLTVSCPNANFAGELTEAATTLSLSPTFPANKCTAFGIVNASVTPNGCAFQYVLGFEDAWNEYIGGLNIVCPEGKGIEVKAGTCLVTIPAQEGLELLGFGNENGAIDVTAAVANGLEYVKTKDGLFCPLSGTGTNEDGALTGEAALEGDHPIRVGG